MTNQVIILMNSIELMKEGTLKGSGVFADVEINGKREHLELPEEIHTYNGWKERGFIVKKGEHSSIKFPIWKYTSKENEEGEEVDSNMFMKLSAFFTKAQVEPITA